MSELTPPNQRYAQIIRPDVERILLKALAEGALNHGWILAGPKGAGKATLAYRIARAVLDPAARSSPDSFDVPTDARVFRLAAQNAHPDLFVAERQWNEKNSKLQTEISVETIRSLTAFLNHTPALGEARVAIIDNANELNRSAANALLKILEEPPRNALLMLLSPAPGRLLPTIRSRCRILSLPPAPSADIRTLLEREGLADGADAERIADHAGGRPGYALSLAAEGGAAALKLAEGFLKAARERGDIARIASKFSARTPSEEWEFFTSAVASSLSDAARAGARGLTIVGPLAGASPDALTAGWEQATSLFARGDAVNVDRGQIVSALGYDLQRTLGAQ